MRRTLRFGAAAAVLALLAAASWVLYLAATLPDISSLKRYRPPVAAEVLDRNGRFLTQYHDRVLRFWVPISSLPEHVILAVVIAEDDTFFEHGGINFRATWDAFLHDVKKRRFARGGSTITQQMIKNVLLTREKTLTRKVREYLLARKAEDVLTKRQILEIYLNAVEWGERVYGIEAAARFYFDKHAAELSVGESALLAGMLPNPRYYNPFKRPDKARNRQERVLSNMVQAKAISEEAFNEAVTGAPALRAEGAQGRFDLSSLAADGRRPCYQRVLESVFLDAYGESGLYREGKRLRTTLDRDLQSLVRERDAGSEVPDQIIVVRSGGEVLSIACASDEAAVRASLEATATPAGDLQYESTSPGSLRASDLLVREAAP